MLVIRTADTETGMIDVEIVLPDQAGELTSLCLPTVSEFGCNFPGHVYKSTHGFLEREQSAPCIFKGMSQFPLKITFLESSLFLFPLHLEARYQVNAFRRHTLDEFQAFTVSDLLGNVAQVGSRRTKSEHKKLTTNSEKTAFLEIFRFEFFGIVKDRNTGFTKIPSRPVKGRWHKNPA